MLIVMTLIIVVAVREGIVLASDSRLTLSATKQEGDKQVVQMAIAGSDSNSKLFLTPSNVGILCAGQAEIKGVPIAGHLDSFINEELSQNKFDIDEIAGKLLEFFLKFENPPSSTFILAGYKKNENIFEQHIWDVNVAAKTCRRINDPNKCWVSWNGEADILNRLVNPTALKQANGTYNDLPFHPIEFTFFTLQDAIDFSLFAVRATIDTMRFQTRAKTVGGPVDILVIKPKEAKWIQRKELHA
jgi:hypothetical protein